jgi:citrate lyase subunit beta / citryl-CoA lyase
VCFRTVALVFGPHDYVISLGYEDFEWGVTMVPNSNFQLGWVMHEISTHAHARGLLAIDGVARPFDEDGYRASSREALLIGFDGKWCMNEDEVAWANEAWTPELSVFRKAESVLAATPSAGTPTPGTTVVPPNHALLDQAARIAARGCRAGLRAET